MGFRQAGTDPSSDGPADNGDARRDAGRIVTRLVRRRGQGGADEQAVEAEAPFVPLRSVAGSGLVVRGVEISVASWPGNAAALATLIALDDGGGDGKDAQSRQRRNPAAPTAISAAAAASAAASQLLRHLSLASA